MASCRREDPHKFRRAPTGKLQILRPLTRSIRVKPFVICLKPGVYLSGTRCQSWLKVAVGAVATGALRIAAARGLSMRKLTRILMTGLVCLSPWASYAQEVSPAIPGRAANPSGGAAAGAPVTAKDKDAGPDVPTTT